MGNFYVNISVRIDDAGPVTSLLESLGRTAFVTEPQDGWVVVYDEACDSQDSAEIRFLGTALSKRLHRPALAVLNHDDDILAYWLFGADGKEHDGYDSNPGYFDGDREVPMGGDARILCNVLEAGAEPRVIDGILHPLEVPDFAVEQHEMLASALGLPECSVGLGYGYVAKGALEDVEVIRVNGSAAAAPPRRKSTKPRAAQAPDAFPAGLEAPPDPGGRRGLNDATTMLHAEQVLAVLDSRAAGTPMAEHLLKATREDRAFVDRLRGAAGRCTEPERRAALERLLALIEGP